MTLEEYLQSVEAREKAATKGPWKQTGLLFGAGEDGEFCVVNADGGVVCVEYEGERKPRLDTEFIAQSRADIPNLLLLVRKYREALIELKSACKDVLLPALNKKGSTELWLPEEMQWLSAVKNTEAAINFDPRKGQE